MGRDITIGMNRTGLASGPLAADDMIDYAQAEGARAPDQEGASEAMHMAYMEQAEAVGTVPVPATSRAASPADKPAGRKPGVLIDKLGERLAFERAGTRLYEAMLLKCGAAESGAHPIGVPQLARIRDEEEAHFRLVKQALESLGADPTAMTPSADVAGVQGLGLMQVITDPRTTIAQGLNALLTAELSDNAAWELLIELARASGHDELGERFGEALRQEGEHLAMVRGWLREAVLKEAT